MRKALIDIAVDLFARRDGHGPADLARMFDALDVHGLAVTGSAPSPVMSNCVRLVVEAKAGQEDALPAKCESEWHIVSPMFVVESHGDQKIVKVQEVRLVGRPHLTLAA